MTITKDAEKLIIRNYYKIPIKTLVTSLNISEHYIKKVARDNGIVKKRKQLVLYEDQKIMVYSHVKRKYAREAQSIVDETLLKFR